MRDGSEKTQIGRDESALGARGQVGKATELELRSWGKHEKQELGEFIINIQWQADSWRRVKSIETSWRIGVFSKNNLQIKDNNSERARLEKEAKIIQWL